MTLTILSCIWLTGTGTCITLWKIDPINPPLPLEGYVAYALWPVVLAVWLVLKFWEWLAYD